MIRVNPITHGEEGLIDPPPWPILQQNDDKCVCQVSYSLMFSFLVLISFSDSLVDFQPKLQII